MDTEKIRRQLIDSAVDYLKSAVEAFDEKPKRSIVDFAVATELFLKARLMAEHWTLVVAAETEANAASFRDGAFQSVTIDSAFKRLRNVMNDGLTPDQEGCFRKVANHRNKAIHFYHDALATGAQDTLKAELAREQCLAWFHLERLLTDKWKNHFEAHLDAKTLDDCRNSMKKQRGYLAVVFDNMARIIEIGKLRGNRTTRCCVCGYEACSFPKPDADVMKIPCLVCGAENRILTLPCPGCGERLRLDGPPSCRCRTCKTSLSDADFDALLKAHKKGEDTEGLYWLSSQTSLPCPNKSCGGSAQYNSGSESYCDSCNVFVDPKQVMAYLSSMDELSRERLGEDGQYLCNECGADSSVIIFEGKYICIRCVTTHDGLFTCPVCGCTGTAMKDYDRATGCSVCGGDNEREHLYEEMGV